MFVPSILAHIVGGAVLVFALIYLVFNNSRILALDSYRTLILILLFSVAVTVHGISHLGLEKIYSYSPWYNPLQEVIEEHSQDNRERRRDPSQCPWRQQSIRT